jgi:hypothetical protein
MAEGPRLSRHLRERQAQPQRALGRRHCPDRTRFSMVNCGLVTVCDSKEWTKQAAARGAGNRRFFLGCHAPGAPIEKPGAKWTFYGKR